MTLSAAMVARLDIDGHWLDRASAFHLGLGRGRLIGVHGELQACYTWCLRMVFAGTVGRSLDGASPFKTCFWRERSIGVPGRLRADVRLIRQHFSRCESRSSSSGDV